MTQILDLVSSSDPRDVVHRAVQALAEGDITGLPLDTTYAVCVAAFRPDGERLLADHRSADLEPLLVVGTAEAATDYLPPLTQFQRRLVRRCCPGPVQLRFSIGTCLGLVAALPRATQQLVTTDDEVRLMVAGSGCLPDVLHLLPGPLLAFLPPSGSGAVASAGELCTRYGDLVRLVIDAGPVQDPRLPTDIRVHADHWEVLREGPLAAETVASRAATVVLFVCTGNTCRSPMAEAMFRKLLAARLQCPVGAVEDRGFVVQSAGLSAACGMPASPEAIDLVRRYGVNLDRHKSQPVTAELLSSADYVLTMTARHRQAVLDRFPELAPRIRTLAPDGSDVPDPIGGGPVEYRRCLEQIAGYLQHWVDRIAPAESGDEH